MYGVLVKFQSQDTSFKQYKEHIEELPTVTICMARLTFYEYGIDLLRYSKYFLSFLEYYDLSLIYIQIII